MPPVAALDAFQDLIDHLSDYAGGDGVDRGLSDYTRAAQLAYRDVPLDNRWRAYLTRGRIYLNPAQSDGTIDIDVTGGANERQVTLVGSTWPTWAAYGTLLVNGVRYKVSERVSNTVLTLTYDSCPTVDIPALTTYTLYQNIYPLPEDFRQLDGIHYEQGLDCFTTFEGGVSEWLHHDQQEAIGGRPLLYAIGGSPDTHQYAKMSLFVYPYPIETESFDFTYWRTPRRMRYSGLGANDRVGTVTVSAGSASVTGSSTQFNSKMIGSLIRFSEDGTNYPNGIGGPNPYVEQRVITAVSSATAITLNEPLTYSYAAVKYVVTDPIDADGALLMAIYRNAEMQLDNFRNPSRLPVRKALYRDAFESALERDQRLMPTFGLYGTPWSFGGTLIVTNEEVADDDDDETPDPGGGGEAVPELLFSQTSIETVDTSTSEEALSGTGEGSLTIDAGSWELGDAITVRASGTYGSKTPTAGTLTLRLKWGSAITQVFTFTLPDAQSSKTWTIESTLTRHSIGAGGTVSGGGFLLYAVTGELAPQSAEDPVANETCDTTVNQTIALTAQFSASDAANTITCSSLTVNQEGPN